MKRVFAPGCALVLYKPDAARRLQEYLGSRLGPIGEHLTCCHHEPGLPAGTQVVNVCLRQKCQPSIQDRSTGAGRQSRRGFASCAIATTIFHELLSLRTT